MSLAIIYSIHLFFYYIIKLILGGESQALGFSERTKGLCEKIGMKLEINYKKETGKLIHVEIKQYAFEQTIGQRRKQKRNQKLP